jgi:hypothetical protein
MIEIELKQHVVEGVFRPTQELDLEDFRAQERGSGVP